MINLAKINRTLLFLLFFISAPLWAADDADQAVVRLLQSAQQLPLQQRIVQFSGTFLNKPYQFEPLGEGGIDEFNHDPLYRLDKFDCETYVDTVMALALSNNFEQFQGLMNKIRYHNDEISFSNRNHFTSADWIPNSQKLGIIKDVTTQIAGRYVETSRVYINRKNWYQHLPMARVKQSDVDQAQQIKAWQHLRALNKKAINSTANVDYIPTKVLLQDAHVSQKIPDGAIIFLVLEDPENKELIGTENNISHMGFAVWKNKILYLRAASTLGYRVRDLPLLPYLSKHSPATGLRGISVWEVTSLG